MKTRTFPTRRVTSGRHCERILKGPSYIAAAAAARLAVTSRLRLAHWSDSWNISAPTGHDETQAGSSPSASRDAHKSHLTTTLPPVRDAGPLALGQHDHAEGTSLHAKRAADALALIDQHRFRRLRPRQGPRRANGRARCVVAMAALQRHGEPLGRLDVDPRPGPLLEHGLHQVIRIGVGQSTSELARAARQALGGIRDDAFHESAP